MGIKRLKEFWPDWTAEDVIGTGAFGKVYKAVNNEAGFSVHSAIKVISIPSSEAEIDALRSEGMTVSETKNYFKGIVDDFVNEIKLMHTLKGAANIVAVEAFKIAEKNDSIGWDIFIRMELLTSFKDYLERKSPSEKEIVGMGIDITHALEICHQRNIIHRDIKPANIFVDDFDSFKLGDFGIAKELEKTTGAISAKGTFSYMAPEVAHGQRYDNTVDIYSLGLVMYNLLNNNRPPFVDPHKPEISYNERKTANDRRLSGEPLPPPCNASQKLADIILTACSYDPAKRFKSAKAFNNALKSFNNSNKVFVQQTKPVSEDRDLNQTVAVNKPMPKTAVNQSSVNIIDSTENTRDKEEHVFIDRLLPNALNRLIILFLPLLLLIAELKFRPTIPSNEMMMLYNACILGITVGFFACITFYYPLKQAPLYFLLYLSTRILLLILSYSGYEKYSNGLSITTLFNFLLPFLYIYLKDTSKNKHKRPFSKKQLIVVKASIANYIALSILLAVIFVAYAFDEGLAIAVKKAIETISSSENLLVSVTAFTINISVALISFKALYNFTVQNRFETT